MSFMVEFIALCFVFLLFGVIISFYMNRNRKEHVLKSPSNVAMIRIIYMYRDILVEDNPSRKIVLLDEFEQTLLDFISQYEEVISDEEKEFVNGNVKRIESYRSEKANLLN